MSDGGGKTAQGALQKDCENKASLLERLWGWIHKTFPERQVYIRSDGRVQFFTLSPSLQATMAGLTLIFLGWVAFATVNVVFKDRIIAAKDHRYQLMRISYENRVASLQNSYNALNGALASAQNRFKTTADALEAKQNAIASFLNRANQAGGVGGSQASLPTTAPHAPGYLIRPAAQEAGELDVSVPIPSPGKDTGQSLSSELTVMPGPAMPQERTAHPIEAGVLDTPLRGVAELFHTFVQRISLALSPAAGMGLAYATDPALHSLSEQSARIAHIAQGEDMLMANTASTLEQGIGSLRNVIRHAGINPDRFARQIAGDGMGGPEIPLDQVRIEGISDPVFTRAYWRAALVLGQLNVLSTAVNHLPFAAPVSAPGVEMSSGFGPRLDPFTQRYAFHPGIDFAAPWGALVEATAPGTVVFAGNRGSYGAMVEIDHGYGVHSRYGHLSAILVRVGAKVSKGTAIGRIGSTGRSTGPHVHYEVWYDDMLMNPSNFFEAGRHVL